MTRAWRLAATLLLTGLLAAMANWSQSAVSGHEGMLYDPRLALIVACSFWVSGLCVLVGANPPSVAVSLAALHILAGLAIVGAAPANAGNPLGRHLEFLWLSLLPIPFIWFFALFPVGVRLSRRVQRRVQVLLWSITGACIAFPLMYFGMLPAPPYEHLRRLVSLLLGMALLAGVWLAARKYQAEREQRRRSELKIIAFGVAVGVLPVAVFSVLPVAFGREPLLAPEVAAVATILVPVSLSYAALRRDLLEIDLMVSYVLVYGVFLAGVVAAYYLVAATFRSLVPEGTTLWNGLIMLAVTLVALLVYQPARRWLERQTHRCLFGEDYDFQTALSQFSELLTHVRPLEVLCEKTLAQLGSTLNLTGGAVLQPLPNGEWKTVARWGAWEPKSDLPEVPAEELTPRVMVRLSAGVRIPLRSQGRDLVVLVVGPRAGGYPFGPRDALLLRTLAPQFAVAVDNALLLNQLETALKDLEIRQTELSRVRDLERQALARDLHDGILQRLFYLKRLVETEAAAGGVAPETADRLVAGIRDAIAEVRALCTDLQPLALEGKGLADALAMLAEEVRKRWGLSVYFVASPPEAGKDLDPRSQLSLLMAAREMLWNVVRHAQADEGYVYLEEDQDELVLSVWDDGRGFEVPCDLTALVQAGHLGLANLEQRARDLGGRLHIQSRPGEGTLVSLRIPRVGDSGVSQGSVGGGS